MADRHGGIALQQQEDQGTADEQRAPDHDGLGALQRDVVGVEQLDHARRRARPQAGATLRERARALGREPVHVLARVDQRRQGVAVEMLGDRELEQDPADGLVVVQRTDSRGHLLLRDIGGEALVEGPDADLLTRPLLVGHVDLRCRVVPDQHGRQARRMAELGLERRDLPRHLLANPGGHGLAVDDRRSHRYRLVIGACAAISLRSEPSPAKRTTTIPPGSTPVTTPSPKAACTTSSPRRNSGVPAASPWAPDQVVWAARHEPPPGAAPTRGSDS